MLGLRGRQDGAVPDDAVEEVAADLPRGWLPRGFSGEQPYWTIVGLDGGREQGLIGEDGAIEIAKGGVSVEPFVQVDGRWIGWAIRSAPSSSAKGCERMSSRFSAANKARLTGAASAVSKSSEKVVATAASKT